MVRALVVVSLSLIACKKDPQPQSAPPEAKPAPAPETTTDCATLTRAKCLASTACTLHWIQDGQYECRADQGPCEVGIQQTDKAACQAKAECTWTDANCYCPFPGYGQTQVPDEKDPNNAAACACGGGAPAMCAAT